jgi:hypothetical protein
MESLMKTKNIESKKHLFSLIILSYLGSFCNGVIFFKNICFAAFLFTVGTIFYSNSSQKRVPEEAAAHVNARIFYTRCFAIAKKAPPERVGISI